MRYKILFIFILLIAIVVRFYKLGSFPSGLTWDEAAIGYNAYGLVTNHRDEWLNRTPISFRSFGDYKSPLLVYITTIPVALFHLTPFAVRLPVAIAGTAVVVVSFFLTQEILFDVKKVKREPFLSFLPFIVMFMTAISPWGIQYSRLGFESMFAVFFVCLGVFSWLHGRRDGRWFLVGDISFVLSLYAYHSAKIVTPLILLILTIILYRDFVHHKKKVLIGTIFAILLFVPLGYATFFGNANARATSTTILGSPHVLSTFFSHYTQHLSTGFLLQGKDLTYRQSTREMGVLYPLELVFFCLGMLSILKIKELRKIWWVPPLFFVGLVPAALGLDVPHSNRALLAFPWVQVTAAIGIYGAYFFLSNHGLKRNVIQCLGLAVLVLSILNFGKYVQTYMRVFQTSQALADFGYGYEEAISYARSQESSVDKVYFTNKYGQAYIFLLFFKRLTPIEYQGGGLANYVISDKAYADSRGRANTLIIGTPDEFPPGVISVKDIKYPDGNVAFRIVKQ